VLLDDEHAARELTRHLLALGHRRIGFVRGHDDHEASRARLAGYRGALRRAGIAPDAALVAEGDFTFDAGRRAASHLLDRRVRPSAIIACNDDMAAGVMAAAHDRQVAIPAQLSVCGFDDTPLAAMLWPPLTTMHQPISELARTGTQLLLERIAGRGVPPGPHRLHYQLVVRASTAAPQPAAATAHP
jgi:LacI family transcriptional regulator